MRRFRIGINPFLWCTASLLLLSFVAVCVDALVSIHEVGERASRVRQENLPAILESQRSFTNIESLRRLAEVAYVSQDPKVRRVARIEAQALAAESVFGRDSSFHTQALKLSKLITELVGRRDAAHRNSLILEELAREYSRSLFQMAAYVPNMAEVQEIITAFFDSSIPHAGSVGVNPEGIERMESLKTVDAGRTAYISRQCRRHARYYAALLPLCDRQDELYQEYAQTQEVLAENFYSARSQWKTVDASLREMRDNVSSDSEFVTTDALTSIEATSEKAFSTSLVMFGGGVCFFLFYLAVLYVFIVRPIRWTGRKLQDLQQGILHDAVPQVRIVELYHVADLLDRFSVHLAELTSHASQLAEDAAVKRDIEALMTAVFKVSVDGYGVWDPENVYVANEELLKLLGLKDIGDLKEHWDRIGFTGRDDLKTRYETVVENGVLRRETYLKTMSGDSIPFEVTYVPVMRGGKVCILSYFRDLRAQKKAEESLRQAKDEAEAAARVKSEFLARMSHEIRTPMNGVLGLTHLALAGSPPPEQRQYLEKIQASARILLRVINDILDFSKMESGRFILEHARFSLARMLTTVTDLFRAQADEKDLFFAVEADPGLPAHVMGDELRLSQVLLNLCGNALKFTEKGGVTLRIAPMGREGGTVFVRFSIIDTGVGMTAEQLAGLFQPFAQADTSTTRKYGGTGLGLVISKLLIELMGGRIEVSSEAGGGSVFQFTVPLEAAADEVETAVSATGGEEAVFPLEGKSVLLVEDNEINQEIAVALLKSLGISVLVAGNGKVALELLEENTVDAILMDIQMPVMDGLTAARAVREAGRDGVRDVPIIAMTAHAMKEDRDKSLAAGMNDHITKPIDVQELGDKLRRWLSRKA